MPAESDYPLWSAVQAIKLGIGPSAALRSFRAEGGSVRTQTWYRLYGEAQNSLADVIPEASRSLEGRPSGGDIRRFSTVSSSGFLQQVEVFVRDRATGEVSSQPFSIFGTRPIARAAAIDAALAEFEASVDAGGYDEEVLGAVHTGAYEMIPGATV